MHSLKTLHDSRRTRTLPQTRLHAYALSSRNTPSFPFAASALSSAGSITGRLRAADASSGPGKRMAGPQPSARRWESQTIVVVGDKHLTKYRQRHHGHQKLRRRRMSKQRGQPFRSDRVVTPVSRLLWQDDEDHLG
ncbi:uncharacterized protein JCM10292_000532 [Rhodotorula paludigena]|uniref:uncharacterized protein n=1 Tax=Rhodotorula paludigena TaxID=86838 RepID=UPI00317912EB